MIDETKPDKRENPEKMNTDEKESSDYEDNKDLNDIKELSRKSLIERMKDEWQSILKIIQLILSISCTIFFFAPANNESNIAKHQLEQVALIFSAFEGFILINGVFLISRLLKDKIPYRISSIFALVGAVLNFISAIFLIENRRNKFQGAYYAPHMYLASMLSAATVLAFINSVFFAVDGVYTFILKKDF